MSKEFEELDGVNFDAPAAEEENDNIPQNKDFNAQNDDDKVQNVTNKEENQEANFGKFKNPNELLKAYAELEKEFTRRSQKLRELEREKQMTKEDWIRTVDKFFEDTPSARDFASDIAEQISSDPSLKKQGGCLEKAFMRVLVSKYRSPDELMQDGQFLNDYVFNSEAVKKKVIGDYLRDIEKRNPPKTMLSGGMQIVAPSLKPKTIDEAGRMFLKDNK